MPAIAGLLAGHFADYSEEPFAQFSRYDLDDDGVVSSADAALLETLGQYRPALDIDGDGRLDATDRWWLELLIGDGTLPGWGFLDYDSDGAVTPADYAIAVPVPDWTTLFDMQPDGANAMLRPASGASLAYATGFAAPPVAWETVVLPGKAALRPLETPERDALRLQPALAGFADMSVWTLDGAGDGVSIQALRLAADPETGGQRLLLDLDGAGPEPEILLLPGAVFDIGAGRLLQELDADAIPFQKGALDPMPARRLVWNLLISAAHAETQLPYQTIRVIRLAVLQREILALEGKLKAEIDRIISETGRLRKEAASDPCKRLDCSKLNALFALVLKAEAGASESARLARLLQADIDRDWKNQSKIRSALRKGYYKQDLIHSYQKALLITSDILSLDVSAIKNLVVSAVKRYAATPALAKALKATGVSEVGGINLADAISRLALNGISLDPSRLTTSGLRAFRNGYARDLKFLRRSFNQVGAKGMPRALARSRHIAGVVRVLLKTYAESVMRDVAARRQQAKNYIDDATADMAAADLAADAAREYAKQAGFVSQRLGYLNSRLGEAIKDCLDAGAAKDCHSAYKRVLAEIEANEGAALRLARQKAKTARAARDAAQSAYDTSFARAKSLHRALVAARNAPGPRVADVRRQLELKKALLQSAERALADIGRQERETGVDLGASRVRWAQAKFDARAAIAKLNARLTGMAGAGGPTPAELTRQRAEAWKAVDANRVRLPKLRKAAREAENAVRDAQRAYDDARARALSHLRDCVLKGAGAVELPAADRTGTVERSNEAPFFVETVGKPARDALGTALQRARALHPRLVSVSGCGRPVANTPPPAPEPPSDDTVAEGTPSGPAAGESPAPVSGAGYAGLWKAYYGSTVRITVDEGHVTGIIEWPSQRVTPTGYTSGMKYIDAHLEGERIVGTVALPLAFMPGCETTVLHPKFEAELNEDASEMKLRVEAVTTDQACNLVKRGGYQEATYPRLE